MKIFAKIQSLDRRYIYIIVALSIIIPLLIPFNSRIDTTKPTEDIPESSVPISGDIEIEEVPTSNNLESAQTDDGKNNNNIINIYLFRKSY